ncbi:hypothetical protein FQR65_LT20688 [Abscondita terminalis]|nr:hypothetical protein FQR65_LT20688 [Abscondita terminalis]
MVKPFAKPRLPMQPLPSFHCGATRRPAMTTVAAVLLAVASLPSVPAVAQTVYRNVGPDGRVTFSDRQPSQAPVQAGAATGSPSAAVSADPGAGLPYALRQTVGRFPVVLYSAKECTPCESARQLLQSRGIPYTERTVQTEADAAALQKISGQDSLPFATVGKQHLVGYSSSEWTQYLNAAGYPASSQLPAQYQRPAPQPLAPPKPVEPAAAASATGDAQRGTPVQPRPQPAPGTRTNENPAGLTF